jgi:PAS domain S-box-containing protein
MADNDFFTKLARLTPVLLFTADSRGHVEFVNERWTQVTGAPAHELLGDGWTRFVHPDDLLRLTPIWQDTVRHGRSYAERWRFRRPDGTYRWIEIRAEPERDETGEIVHWFGSGTDVDGERRAAAALRLIADSGATIATEQDVRLMLVGVAKAALEGLADVTIFDVMLEDGTFDRVVVAGPGIDPSLERILAAERPPRPQPGHRHPIARAIAEPCAVLIARAEGEFLHEPFVSLVSVPLRTSRRISGAMTLLRTSDRAPFDDSDVSVAQEIARRTASAIENARLAEIANRERAEWERHLLAMYEREHRVARIFQEAALPSRLPDVPGFGFDAIYEASHSEALVGGDWYDAFPLPDGRIVVSIGDVAGSGLHAAVTMSTVRQAIRGIAHVRTDPALMLQAADRALQGNEPDRYVTAFVGVIDPVAATLSYAGAGHPPPYLRKPNGALDSVECGGPPLGVPGVDTVRTIVTPFQPGSMLVLYTDGLIESTHNVIEGDLRLQAALSNPTIFKAEKPAVALRNALLGEGAADDVAILVVESLASVAARRWTFDVRDADDARRVREQVLEQLRKGSYPQNRLSTAELILAELTGNVFRHAAGPSQVVLEWDNERAPILHVIDVGPGFRFDAKPQPDLFAESGRGLYLVSSLAADVKVSQRQDGGSHARVVLKN